MSYDSRLQGMIAMAIGMGSENAYEGLETVQNAEQSRGTCRLPRDMRPSQAAFETLGFTFTDIGDDVLFEATLPKGWSTQELPGSSILRANLLDSKGRVRGSYRYKGSFYERYGHMSLIERYRLTDQYEDGSINVVVIDEDGSVIFNAGRCEETFTEEYDKLVAKAEEYLMDNYPEWKDATKYWD